MTDPACLAWPFFDRTHRNLAEELLAFAASLTPLRAGEDADSACRRLLGQMGEVGLFSVAVPALYGGRHERLDLRSLALVRESLAHAHAGADFVFAIQGLGAGPISLFGSKDQNDRFLPGIARGEAMAATELARPHSDEGPDDEGAYEEGGDDAGGRGEGNGAAAGASGRAHVIARPGRGWYSLEGATGWIANGAIADLVILEAEVAGEGAGEDGGEGGGATCFILETGSAGLHVEERLASPAPASLARLRLEGCRVPRANLLGGVGQGAAIARTTAETFRPCLAAAALGLARHAFAAAERHPAAPIERRGAIAAALDATALLIHRAAWLRDVRGAAIAREAAMAELEAFRAATLAIETATAAAGAEALKPESRLAALPRELQALRLQAAPTAALLRHLADPPAAAPTDPPSPPPTPDTIPVPRPDPGGPEGGGTLH